MSRSQKFHPPKKALHLDTGGGNGSLIDGGEVEVKGENKTMDTRTAVGSVAFGEEVRGAFMVL